MKTISRPVVMIALLAILGGAGCLVELEFSLQRRPRRQDRSRTNVPL